MTALERSIERALLAGLVLSGSLLAAGLATQDARWLGPGLVLLMLTPVARVTVVTVDLIRRRQWLFAAISAWVLVVLLASALLPLP